MFKTLMPKSSLCDYSDSYILVKGPITVLSTAAAAADNPNNVGKTWHLKIIFHLLIPWAK